MTYASQSNPSPLSVASTSLHDRSELVIIDATVADYQAIANSVAPGAEIAVLDPARNGIEQITKILSKYKKLDAVHLISHGSAGSIRLGNTFLDASTLDSYAPQLLSWRSASSENADILLYGCDVGAGETGINFVERLSALTAADIAASTDKTGFNGDWQLEATSGSIETAPVEVPNYQHALAAPVANPDSAVTVADTKVLIQALANDTDADADKLRVSAIIAPASNGFANVEDDVYAAGDFTSPGSHVAKWDGTAWSPLGAGTNAAVYSLAFDGINLYAGGAFTSPGNYIAKWDGTAWSPLGTGTDNEVYALAPAGSTLYAGGFFSNAGGTSAIAIAAWNGSSWSDVGGGMNNTVFSLKYDGTNLYAGGYFGIAGGTSASGVARWNGSSWSALGTGTDNAVRALATVGSNLYAGGLFTTPGSYIAQWNGSTWSPLGTGTNADVYAIATVGTNVYAGGTFTTAGGAPAAAIAKWDGTSWSPLGAGLNGVYAIAAAGNNVYAGGEINFTGSYIAQWNGTSWQALGTGVGARIRAIAVDPGRRLSYTPNPGFSGIDTFTYQITDGSATSTATVTVLVNNSPVLDNTGNPTFTPINAGDANNPGTLISALIASGAAGNPITDPNVGAAEGIAVTAADTANGTWQYSTDGGTTWNPLGAVSDTNARLLADTARIRFIPANPAFSGTVANAITFRAWDQIGAFGGSTALGAANGTTLDVSADLAANGASSPFSTATETASITVTVPVVAAVTSSQLDGSYGIGTVIPIAVTFSETVVVTGTPQIALNSGGVATYASGSGTNTLTFNYAVAAGNSTVDLEYTAITALTLAGGTIKNATSTGDAVLNLPPLGATNSLGGSKALVIDGIAPTVTVEQAVGQVDPAPTSPVNFTVTFSEPVSGFDAADLNFAGTTAGGTLTPTITGSGTTYNVAVSGMTTSGNVVLSVNANAATDAVNNPNAASTSTDNSVTYNTVPTISAVAKSGSEDTPVAFTAADFTSAFSDGDGDALNKIKITSLPANGTLTLNGTAVTANQEILATDLGNLAFAPAANFNGTASFTWNASDGSNYASADAAVNLTVNSVNDAPSFSNLGNQILSTWTNAPQTVAGWANTFNFGAADEAAQTVSNFLVTVTSGAELFATAPAIAADGTLTYTPNGTPGTATVQVQLQDSGGTANGGVDTSAPATFTVTVPPPTVELSLSSTTAPEAGGTIVTVTATASGAVTGNQTLALALSGTATAADFTGIIPAQITIPNGSNVGSVSLIVANDFLDEGNETATLTVSNPSAGILLGSATSQTFAIAEDDTAGVAISASTINLTEGGAASSYNIVLTSQPTAPVTISFNTDSQVSAIAPITFDSNNWNIAQTVAVSAIDDLVAEGTHSSIITQAATSTDLKYNGIAIAGAAASIADNETAAISIVQPVGNTRVLEGYGTDVYKIALTTQPTADVTIAIATDGQITADTPTVTFTPTNWNIAQTVTLTAVDDSAVEGEGASTLSHIATSADANYNGIAIAPLLVNVSDNEVSGTVANLSERSVLNLTDADDKVTGSPLSDILDARAGNDRLEGGAGNDILYGQAGDDGIAGGDGADVILGNQGSDRLNGNAGSDMIYGGSQSDRLYGGAGNDQLFGEEGNDLMFGDLGADTLTGGLGSDAFAIGTGTGGQILENADIIADFSISEDKIYLIGSLTLSQLNIFQGTGANANDTIFQDTTTGEFLAVLHLVAASSLTPANFV